MQSWYLEYLTWAIVFKKPINWKIMNERARNVIHVNTTPSYETRSPESSGSSRR